jgi:hypothetical protein
VHLIQEHNWPGLAYEYRVRQQQAWQALAERDSTRALSLMAEAYEVLAEAQPDGRRLHKGEVLHNWGLVLLTSGDVEGAVRKTLAAFVEDAASLAEESPADYAELTRPAARNLVFVFGLSGPMLAAFGALVRRHVGTGGELRDPEAFLEIPATQELLDSRTPTATTTMMENLKGAIGRAVFVGGGYGNDRINTHLRPMRDHVVGLGYEGVIVADLEAPEDWRSDHKSIALLGLCQFAIFDATDAAGQQVEVYELSDRQLRADRTLIIWDADITERPQLSGGMNLEKLRAYGIEPKPYHGIDDARATIDAWLPRLE